MRRMLHNQCFNSVENNTFEGNVLGGINGALPMRKTRGVTALDIIASTKICIM
jgi:hypothetical protein